jgi:hypothetical protein
MGDEPRPGTQSTMARRWHGDGVAGHGGALAGARPPAALRHGSSPAGAQKGEGSVGNPS